MAEIMDPFAHELLARPPPPGFDQFSCGGAMSAAKITIEQLDDYFRAIGALPPRPPVDDFPSPAATFPLKFAADCASELPAPCQLHATASDTHVQPPAAVPRPPASDGSAAVAPYDADIDASLRAAEQDPTERPSPDYLDTTQGGRIDAAARAALVQWMSDFSRRYYLDAAILHRAVAYVDRFLSARALPADAAAAAGGHKHRLRLLGAVAVYAAAKLEDPGAARDLDARHIACWCGHDATCLEVLDAERALLAALGYRLAGPTASTFVDHFTRRGQGSEEGLELRRVAHRIADASLLDHRCLRLLPSAVAAAAIFLARLLLKPSYGSEHVQRWGRELKEMTGYWPVDVRDGVECLHQVMTPTPGPGLVILPTFFAEFREQESSS